MSTVTPHLLRSALVAALGSPSLRVRHGRHLGHDRRAAPAVPARQRPAGLHCRQRAGRHDLRLDCRGQAGRAVRPPAGVPDRGRPLLRVGARQRPRVGLAFVPALPLPRRPGVGAASVVAPMYIAEISPPPPRPAGGAQPVQRRGGDPDRLPLELRDRGPRRRPRVEAWRWMLGIQALPAALFFLLVLRTPESPRWLVSSTGAPRPPPCSARSGSVEPDGPVRRSRSRCTRRSVRPREPLFQRKYGKPILLAVMDRLVQPALGDQRAHLLHGRHLQDGRRRAHARPPPVGRRRRDEPPVHDAGHDRDRSLRAQRLLLVGSVGLGLSGPHGVGVSTPAWAARSCSGACSGSSPRTPSARGR